MGEGQGFARRARLGAKELKELPEELGRDGFLSIGRRVCLVEGLQKGPDGGE